MGSARMGSTPAVDIATTISRRLVTRARRICLGDMLTAGAVDAGGWMVDTQLRLAGELVCKRIETPNPQYLVEVALNLNDITAINELLSDLIHCGGAS